MKPSYCLHRSSDCVLITDSEDPTLYLENVEGTERNSHFK